LEELSGVVSAGRGNGIGIRRGDTSPSLGVLTTEMGHQLPTVIVASSTAYGESVQQLQKKNERYSQVDGLTITLECHQKKLLGLNQMGLFLLITLEHGFS